MSSSYANELERARARERDYRTRLSQVTRLTRIGYWKWDEDKGVPVEIDDQVGQIFGKPKEALVKELMENRLLEKIHPGDHDKYSLAIEEYLQDVRQNGASARQLETEYRIIRPDGQICFVRSQSEPEFDKNGRFTHSHGYLQELTEFYKAKADRERVAEDLTRLVDTANAPIFGINEHGHVNEWNQQAEVLTGYGKSEVMGRDLVADFITDDYKDPVGEVLEKALRGEETANYEFPLYTKAGNRLDVLLNSTTRRDTDGRIVGVVGVGQDITELNRAKADRERVAEDLTRLVDTANAPIFGINEHGHVNEWNQQAEVLTGYGKSEVMGRDLVADFITDDYKGPVGEVLEKALRGEETANYEFPLYTKAGNRLDVLLNSTTRRDTDGRIVGVVGVGQDITELRKSQAQVIQTSKLASLGEMATSVAHELNQPLNTIRMASSNIVDAIELDRASPEYLQNKLERIDSQVERASSIINHMRMFGREADEKYEQLDPREIIQDTLGLIGEQLRLAGIDVVICCSPACPDIRGHRIQLEQVLVNLLTNARDAIMESDGHAGRKIIIHGELVGDHSLEISIADTGGGIAEKNLIRIFDPFFTTKEIGKGTGLGLSVSFGIIRDMGGNLSADNSDEGAKFIITLPAVKKSAELR